MTAENLPDRVATFNNGPPFVAGPVVISGFERGRWSITINGCAVPLFVRVMNDGRFGIYRVSGGAQITTSPTLHGAARLLAALYQAMRL